MYNENTNKWYKWINLQPEDEYLTMQNLNHKVWGTGGQLVIKHRDQPREANWHNLSDCIYKLHIKINGVYKYVPLPIKINLDSPASGVYMPNDSGATWENELYEDPDSLNQVDSYGNPKPDADNFSHIISNYEGLPVATKREISSRMIDANSDMYSNHFLNANTTDKIRF